ncbi:hypothetical protein J437_LFUL010753 [Ladona fulva]|uniref:NHR domain-containing protein n=1 Tax=Ladona fulva TaxID=123851 RepID=A0A8K0KGA0_LADFU|nr:hypothetical protein J437_LFUL010753 [Ladona fulva]
MSISGTSASICDGNAGKKHRMVFSINSIRNDEDEWETKFSASQNLTVKPRNIDVNLTRLVVDCHENYFIDIKGIIKENSEEEAKKRLIFHSKCSSQAAITNDGRTLQKIKLNGRGAALTNRPLMDNEIFTVRIDKKDGRPDGIGIGVTTHAPGTLELPDHINSIGTGTWMFYHNHLYHNSKEAFLGYQKTPLKDVKVGQRVGVMRSKSGTLHFFLDGVDQGPAASNLPETVYGAFELFENLLQGTIVDA